MTIEIPQYKYLVEHQILEYRDNVSYLLIGENGSGKSTILESIFKKYIEDKNKNIICFTSGQNELFSKIFDNHKKSSNRFTPNENNIIKSYFFDKNWIRLLIFFSTSLKSNGYVRKFLLEKRIIEVNTLNNTDVSSKISFNFGVNKKYIDIIKSELLIESRGEFVKNSKRRTKQFSLLQRLINHKVNENYDFDDISHTITKRYIEITSNEVDAIFNSDTNSIFTFLSHSVLDKLSNIDIDSISLFFNNELEFNQLSDGEYQLLSIYSLIDLFDTPDTIFLFDEVDSHLHYKNIQLLWHTLKNVNGKVLSTSHIVDSIIINDFDTIKLIENGNIQLNTPIEKVFERLNTITSNDTYKFKISSKLKNIVLVENYTDWFIFKELCRLKINNFNERILDDIHYINCSSEYSAHTVLFGNSKVFWYKKYKEIIEASQSRIRNLFMICDRDELPIDSIKENLTVTQTDEHKLILKKHSNTTPYLMSWRRKQIENYLISKTILDEYGITETILNKLERSFEIVNTPMDCIQIQKLEIKDEIKILYSDENGVDYLKLKEVIGKIPKNEISEDIVIMYEFIKSKVE